MGQTTGSNPTKTGERIKKYLNTLDPKSAVMDAKLRRVRHRVVSKLGKKIDKKFPQLDKTNRENMKNWQTQDLYKSIVDWKIHLGVLLVEGSLSVARTLRKLKGAAKKKNNRAANLKSGNDAYDKWHKKKMFRANQPSYKKHVLGENS